jgi:hypothetical protein
MNEPELAKLLPAFDELAPTLDTGDLVLFGGESRFCKAIKRFSGCRWSHVALVARPHAGGPLLLWEATLGTDIADLVTHEISPGVHLYDLAHWIRHYGGETAIRPLAALRTDAMRSALLAFYYEARDRPFERNRLEFLRAVYDGPLGRNRREDPGSFFCSELVAEAYQRMNLLPAAPPANEYTPRDFSSETTRPLALPQGAELGAEVLVCRQVQPSEQPADSTADGQRPRLRGRILPGRRRNRERGEGID